MFARAARCYMCVILCPDAFNVGRVPKIGNVASWSIGMNMVFKFTCDAARLMNAPKLFKVCTTCIIQYLGNVENRGSFRGLVRYMATTPQSCIKALVVRIWFGKDDKANVRPRSESHSEPQRVPCAHVGAVHAGDRARRPHHGGGSPSGGETWRHRTRGRLR